MVSYDPERSVSLRRESSKTFGGFDLSLEDWMDVEPNTDYLKKTVDEIYPAEKPSLYSINSNSSTDDLPTHIIIVEDNRGEETTIIPFYVVPEETSMTYRGREKFGVIEREPSDERKYKRSTIDIENGREVASQQYEGDTDYYLYTWNDDDPVAYIPSTYTDPTNVVGLENETIWWSTRDIYFAPDSYLCELCNWSDLYLQKTV